MHERFSFWLFLMAVASSLALGCGEPCKELARKVCSCETSPRAEQSCLDRIEAEAAKISVSDEEDEVCAEKLDTCTCNKLRAGDLAACGLAVDND